VFLAKNKLKELHSVALTNNEQYICYSIYSFSLLLVKKKYTVHY